MSQFGVLVEIAVRPGKFEQLKEALEEFYPQTQKEPGLLKGQVMLDRDDPAKIYIFETWKTEKDFEHHLTTEHCRKFTADIEGTYSPEGYVRYLFPLLKDVPK